MADETVLIADDEEEILDMLEKYLKRERIRVLRCKNGGEVLSVMLDSARGKEVSLVVLDIMMEDMDGFEVLKEIRRVDQQVPVLFLSACQEEYDKVLGLGLGADDYVTKPFSPGELMARIKAHLRRKNLGEKQLRAGNLVFDRDSYRVLKDGQPVSLAGKELLLLVFLMENPGKVFTKAQIYHQVWEDGFEDDNTVMVYISRLREKIEHNPKEPELIQTIRGIGYRFG